MIASRGTLSTEEQRAQLKPDHLAVIGRRATPSIFVVDKRLRVLFYRSDPAERRKDFRPAQNGTLPASIEYTVLKLIAQSDDVPGSVLHGAVSASVAVRVVPLDGNGQGAYALIVERFAVRDQMEAIAGRLGLSPRERQVLALVVKGMRNDEIAHQLFISKSTAVFHVKQLLKKTHSRNRTEMVAKIIS